VSFVLVQLASISSPAFANALLRAAPHLGQAAPWPRLPRTSAAYSSAIAVSRASLLVVQAGHNKFFHGGFTATLPISSASDALLVTRDGQRSCAVNDSSASTRRADSIWAVSSTHLISRGQIVSQHGGAAPHSAVSPC